MSAILDPDEVSHIYLVECAACSEEMWTDGMPVREVRAFAGRHENCDLQVHLHDGMGLIPSEVTS